MTPPAVYDCVGNDESSEQISLCRGRHFDHQRVSDFSRRRTTGRTSPFSLHHTFPPGEPTTPPAPIISLQTPTPIAFTRYLPRYLNTSTWCRVRNQVRRWRMFRTADKIFTNPPRCARRPLSGSARRRGSLPPVPNPSPPRSVSFLWRQLRRSAIFSSSTMKRHL